MYYGRVSEDDVLVYEPFSTVPLPIESPEAVYEKVLEQGGCSFPVRDAVDMRIVNDVRNGTGRIIDSQNEVGGWPELKSTVPPKNSDHDGMPDEWEIAHNLNPNDYFDAKSTDLNPERYTNIEVYINGLVDNAIYGNNRR